MLLDFDRSNTELVGVWMILPPCDVETEDCVVEVSGVTTGGSGGNDVMVSCGSCVVVGGPNCPPRPPSCESVQSCPQAPRSRSPSNELVEFPHTNRFTCFLIYRGFSCTSSREFAGAAAAKQIAGSNVDMRAKAAAIITEDLRIMIADLGILW